MEHDIDRLGVPELQWLLIKEQNPPIKKSAEPKRPAEPPRKPTGKENSIYLGH